MWGHELTATPKQPKGCRIVGISAHLSAEGNCQRKPLVLGGFVRINFGAVMLPKFSQTGVMLLDTGLVPDILGSVDAGASSDLCRAWGQVRDHQSLVFFDPGARANFITPQLAEKMGIKMDEMGPAYTASMAAPGHEVAVTPLIGKLRLHIQGYVGLEEFFIMPLEGCDVLLGMPWFYNHKAVLESFNKTVTLEISDRKIVLDAMDCLSMWRGLSKFVA
ncbi:hypothetical protein L7F22_001498 [Adiantum nelumboides]|nr:hypothetical protein [Adiantum nelumboides]